MDREGFPPLVGHHDRTIDGKDRVVVPAGFAHRIQASSEGRIYLVPSGDAPCLEAYPAHAFGSLADNQIPDRFQGGQDHLRQFFQLAEEVELKGPGRITIPKRFRDYFPSGSVRICGMRHYLELWDPPAWEERMAKVMASIHQPPGPPPAKGR